MNEDLDRVVIVTGAGDTVGTAIACALARQGCTVAAVDRRESLCSGTLDALAALGRPGRAFGADLTLVHEAEATVGRVVEELGPPAALVNNPQLIWSGPHPRAEAEDEWDAVLRTNLRASFLMSRAVRHHLVRRGGGRIVNVASGALPGAGMRTALATARAGLRGFTGALAAELGPFGVTVNAVLPGYVDSRAAQELAVRLGTGGTTVWKEAAAGTPLGRTTRPQDVADTVAYLLSEAACGVTGQTVVLADGELD